MRELWRSAAYRIAFTYAAASAGAILLLGVAVFFAADAQFRRQRDAAIAMEMTDLARESGSAGEITQEIRERETSKAAMATFGYALFDRGGRRIAGSLDISLPPLGFSTIEFKDERGKPEVARADAVDLADGSRLAIAVNSETIEDIDDTILTLFGGAFAVVIMLGASGALLLGRYLKRRLSAISGTAQAIISGDPEQRVPVSSRFDEFDAVAIAINAMLDRIAKLMENLRQVSSDVAHDLRTPLVRLRNQLDRIGHDEDAAERAVDLGDELLKLFAAILRITEVEGGGLEHSFTPIDLTSLSEDVCDGFRPAIADSKRSLDWTIERDIVVLGDRELLAQSLANLLDNARIHTPPRTHIHVTLEAGEDWARLTVADDGPGVPSSDRDAILQRFYRGEASRTKPGNGLGLSLVAAVAQAHGGEVAVSSIGKGFAVTITLPRLGLRASASAGVSLVPPDIGKV